MPLYGVVLNGLSKGPILPFSPSETGNQTKTASILKTPDILEQ
jgi:hypothetical protein